MPLNFMYITNDPQIASIAQEAGVDRIWIDLETLGKAERQAHINSVKSNHQISDIKIIKPLMTTSQLLVRVNPINPSSEEEIEAVINHGADIVMLPMFKTCEEVESFIQYVHRRARVCLLLETVEAENNIDLILKIHGIDEIHIGLNDLHLSHGMQFMFELLADGTVDRLCKKIRHYGIPYGFGGVAKLHKGLIPAEEIITEHYRLGSTQAILSRSFCNVTERRDISAIRKEFIDELLKIRLFEDRLKEKEQAYFFENRKKVQQQVDQVKSSLKK